MTIDFLQSQIVWNKFLNLLQSEIIGKPPLQNPPSENEINFHKQLNQPD